MNDDALLAALARWNVWGAFQLPQLVDRTVTDSIFHSARPGRPVALKGLRRSGKSSVLALLVKRYIDSGVPPRRILYVNFEDPVFAPELSLEIMDRIVTVHETCVHPDGPLVLLFDEVQAVPGWERFARRVADLKSHTLIVTGSSARLLSRELATLMTGRHASFEIFPFSCGEYWSAAGLKKPKGPSPGIKASLRDRMLNSYLLWGGMPEAALEKDERRRESLLRGYLDDILFRDVVMRHNIRDAHLLFLLAQHALRNIATRQSYKRIANVLETSGENVRMYMSHLAEAYLVFEVERFSHKLAERQRNPRKIYACDTGIRNVTAGIFTPDKGRLLENCVALCIRRACDEIYYFNGGGECDFVWREKKRWRAAQVCYEGLQRKDVRQRETIGLCRAMEKLGLATGTVITHNYRNKERIGPHVIEYVPAVEWLD